jgi:ABC-type uncharacterized transport system substrate-binding protein
VTAHKAVLVLATPIFFTERQRIAELAIAHRLPTMFQGRDYVEAGGLMSYYANYDDLWRRAATYVDKILRGMKPADLPVQQPSKFEFVINSRTAKSLGLTIPPAVLARADEVNECCTSAHGWSALSVCSPRRSPPRRSR